jgi:soluble lytic murein transglycosylase-like protein
MRPRLVVLLVLTVVAGLVAGFVGAATAGKPKTAAQQVFRPTFGKCPIPDRFRPTFEQAAQETNLPLALLVSVANVESTFDPNARSPAGGHGLFQILPSTARALKLDVSTPQKNVIAGARYLSILKDEFHSMDLMLAAYNAGPTAVIRAGNNPPNAASRAYVNEVNQLWVALRGCR